MSQLDLSVKILQQVIRFSKFLQHSLINKEFAILDFFFTALKKALRTVRQSYKSYSFCAKKMYRTCRALATASGAKTLLSVEFLLFNCANYSIY